MPTFATPSARWAILAAVHQALATAPQLQGLPVVRNPRTAQALRAGEQMVVIKWGTDSLVDKPGQVERRSFRLIVGSISRKPDGADADADAIHQATGQVVRAAFATLAQQASRALSLREEDITPDIEGIEVDGALVLSSWAIAYQRQT
ncbi:MAG: hypothetical protein IAE92_02465 [Burkholderiaceae bacterium]|nr:hypothetical protein [Burkholderiaceae bacterium]